MLLTVRSAAPADQALQILNSNVSHTNNPATALLPSETSQSQAPIIGTVLSLSLPVPPAAHKALTFNIFSKPKYQTPSRSSRNNLVRSGGCRDSPLSGTNFCLRSLSLAVIKTVTKSSLGREWFVFTVQLPVYHEGKEGRKTGQELRAGPGCRSETDHRGMLLTS